MKINFVMTIEYGKKLYAMAYQTYENYNLKYDFERIKGLKTINYCQSWKRAKEIAKVWNEAYEKNGTLMTTEEYNELQCVGSYCRL